MLHYVVLFRLKPGVTLDRVRKAKLSLAELAETLPGVLHFAVTDNLAPENGGYTLALFSAFESRRAFEIFERHDAVQQVLREDLGPVVAARVVAHGEAS